ncbi:hypothetical protein GCM10028806_14180 [Spirosoma terrae]
MKRGTLDSQSKVADFAYNLTNSVRLTSASLWISLAFWGEQRSLDGDAGLNVEDQSRKRV